MRFSSFVAAFGVSIFLVACGDPGSGTCGPTNCPGCCNAAGVCESGDSQASCGFGGQICSACSSSQTCSSKTCTAVSGGVGGGAGGGAGGGTDGGTPIVAPNEQWTWVAFPDAVCGNGSATGIGINPTTRSNDMFIYMQGGGACWNSFTCFTVQSADNVTTGYGPSKFASDAFKSSYAVNRSAAGNPFKDMSFVYVPYCTGDVHSGDNVATYGTSNVHHKGRKNVEAYLRRLKATFPNATRVFLGGSSAGAYGAQINFELVKQTWPNAQVHVMADCGQMVNPASTLLSDWKASWNLASPPGCPACDDDFTEVPKYLSTTYPASRFGLLAYTQDNVLRQFFGFASDAEFEAPTRALLASSYAQTNDKYFLLNEANHVMLDNLNTLTAPSGKTLNSWVTEWVSGSAGWDNLPSDGGTP